MFQSRGSFLGRRPMRNVGCGDGNRRCGGGACAGRAPQPVAVVQPQDRYSDCAAIAAEMNNQKVTELASEQGLKVGPECGRRCGWLGGLAAPFRDGFSGHRRQGGCRAAESPAILGHARTTEMCAGPARAAGACSQALTESQAKELMSGGSWRPASRAKRRPESCRFGVAFRRTKRIRQFLFRPRSCRQRSPSSAGFRISVGPYLRP